MSQRTRTTSLCVAFDRTGHCFKKALEVVKTTDILIERKGSQSYYRALQNITSTKNRSCVNGPDGKSAKLHATQLISQR